MAQQRAHNPRRMQFRGQAPTAGIAFFADMWLHIARTDGTHYHGGDQLLAIVDGTLAMEVDGRAFTLKAGDAVTIPGGTPHHVLKAPGSRAARLLNLVLTPDDSILADQVHRLPRHPLPVDPRELHAIAAGLPADADGADADLPTVMAAVWRMVELVHAAAKQTDQRVREQALDPRVAMCEVLIHELLDQTELGCQLLADRVNLSRSQLDRLYRDQFGHSSTQRICDLRLERARHLLIATGYSVKQIAGACGFGRTVNLTRALRDAEGCTPSEYRERMLRVDD